MDQITFQTTLQSLRDVGYYNTDDSVDIGELYRFSSGVLDLIEGINARICRLENVDIPCNCGWGGVHDEDNPQCERNQ